MRKIVLICQRVTNEIDVVHGLDNIRNYAMEQDNLKDQVEIEILSPGPQDSIKDITDQIIDKTPDMVGLSTFIWTITDNIKIAEELKKRLQEVKIIFGGPQVSDINWDIMQYSPDIDGVIRGEGEIVFSEMLRFWLSNDKLCSRDIPGFSFRDITGGIVHNPGRFPIKNMDIIPSRYKNFEANVNEVYGLETARGCYNKCGYCALGSMPFRMHSIEYVLEEIDNMAKAGIKKVYILDSSFTFDRRRMEQISRRLADYGIKYLCCAEAEELDSDIMDILLETGAMKVDFGLQSSNSDALAFMNRKFNIDLYAKNIIMFIEKCKGRSLEVNIDVICGLPGDNLKTYCQSIDFAYSLRPHCVSSFPLLLLPGTEVYKNHEKYGLKFIPFTQEIKQSRTPYNMHKYGLVFESSTFSSEELKMGQCICLFNNLIMQSRFIKQVFNTLNSRGITFTQFYNDINSYLPDNFYDCLQAELDLENRRFISNSINEAFLQYDKAI